MRLAAYFRSNVFGSLLLSLFCISFTTQFYLYIYRDELLSIYTQASESQLYSAIPNVATILDSGNGEILFKIINPTHTPIALIDGAGKVFLEKGDKFSLQLPEGISHVTLILDHRQEKFIFEYTPSKIYENKDLKGYESGQVALRSSSSIVGEPLVGGFQSWLPRESLIQEPAASYKWQQNILDILIYLEGRRGVPNDLAIVASPDELIQLIDNRQTDVWCKEVAEYGAIFLAKKGFYVRMLGASGRLPNSKILTGGHTFFEIFDEHFGRWVFSDPTNYIVSVHWKNSIPLSAIEFQRLVSTGDNGQMEGVKFLIADIKSIKNRWMRWDQLSSDLRADLTFYFSTKNNLYYFSGASSVYQARTINKVFDWVSLRHRYVIANSNSFPAIALGRIFSFWVMVASSIALLIFMVVRSWRGFLKHE